MNTWTKQNQNYFVSYLTDLIPIISICFNSANNIILWFFDTNRESRTKIEIVNKLIILLKIYLHSLYWNVKDKAKPKYCSLIQYYNFTHTSPPGSPPSIKEVNYEQLKEYINQNEALIIDVRTKKELVETGVLPNSYNIPSMYVVICIVNYLPKCNFISIYFLVEELASAFRLTPDEFLKKYNFPKPDINKTIIFSCAKGIRSLIACNHLTDLGYKKYEFNFNV